LFIDALQDYSFSHAKNAKAQSEALKLRMEIIIINIYHRQAKDRRYDKKGLIEFSKGYFLQKLLSVIHYHH
jgi:hypothetical protein